LLPKDAVFFLEVNNDLVLVLIHPASKRCQKDMPRPQIVEHPAILRRFSFWTERGSKVVAGFIVKFLEQEAPLDDLSSD
jgi:hypothetical protein